MASLVQLLAFVNARLYALAAVASCAFAIAACADEVDAPERANTPVETDGTDPTPPETNQGTGETPPPATDPPHADAGGDAAPKADAGGDAGIPHAPLLKAGLHPDASDALRYIGITAGQITQTIGNAAASAGTHAQDGTVDGKPYGCATDLSVSGKSEAQIKTLLGQLGEVGFAAWYRKPGFDGWPSSEAPHIHAVWAGAKMKLSLRDQVHDWLAGKNGLVSHTTYQFYQWPQTSKDLVKARFLSVNPATN